MNKNPEPFDVYQNDILYQKKTSAYELFVDICRGCILQNLACEFFVVDETGQPQILIHNSFINQRQILISSKKNDTPQSSLVKGINKKQ